MAPLQLNVISGTTVACSLGACAGPVFGIWVEASSGTDLTGNIVDGSAYAGIYLGCGTRPSDLRGLGCRGSNGSHIEDNYLLDNVDYGIAIADNSLDNYVYKNRVLGGDFAQLQDYNPGCASRARTPAPPAPNTWVDNTGTPSQSVSATCVG